jgi:hypothetical protein
LPEVELLVRIALKENRLLARPVPELQRELGIEEREARSVGRPRGAKPEHQSAELTALGQDPRRDQPPIRSGAHHIDVEEGPRSRR